MLKVSGVTKRHGARPVLNGVTFDCAPGEVAVIVGNNGTGKTTLLRILAGMILPSSGDVTICGHSLSKQPVQAKCCMGYVPDGLSTFPDLLVSEFLTLVSALKAHAVNDRERAQVDVTWKTALGVEQTWSQRIRTLSFGQRKRVLMLAALTGGPEVLLLDEPTNGIDSEGIATVHQLIERRRRDNQVSVLCTNDAAFVRSMKATQYRLVSGRLVANS